MSARSLFALSNSLTAFGPSATSLGELGMSACGGRADVSKTSAEVRADPKPTLVWSPSL